MQLKASARQPLGKRSRRMLRGGKLPAIVYGHNTEATPITLDRLEFQKVFVKSGRTHLVDLVLDGGRTAKVLVREIQTHPRQLGPIHVDFYQVNLQEKIEVEVPVRLTGESAPVKRGDADILQPLHAIRVECLPVAATYVVARIVARFVGEKVREQHMRAEMVVVTRRVVTAGVIVLGVFLALGCAAQNANVTLFGLLLATVVAALGVQQLLQDYVSGYYVLLERHIRIGDRITFDEQSGTVTDVRLRVTLIKSDAGDLIVVPNSELFTKAG